MDINRDENKWKSKLTFRILLFMQYVGLMNMTSLPEMAITEGVTGYIIVMIIFYILLGTPLAYMESIVGQFTERDCIDVWKIRPCLSHIGYILICWQFGTLIFNHAMTSFVLHYFLISFENPIPYLICGPWSDKSCNIIFENFTINQECAQKHDEPNYCDDLYKTFPEYQYWRYHLLHYTTEDNYYVAWRACLGSAIICVVVYFICFKRETSLKYSVPVLCFVPMIGLLTMFMGSMRQIGILERFEESIDMDFRIFSKQFRLSHMIQLVIQDLVIGTGLTFNLTSSSSFRTTCLSNCVIGVALCALFTTISILTITMMSCPYAYQYDETMVEILKSPLFLTFERFPRFLSLFYNKQFYLILTYGVLSALGIGTNILIYFNLLEVLLKRSAKLRFYPGLTCFIGCVILFFVTIPLLSNFGLQTMCFTIRRHMIAIPTFIALLESLVFVLWYGIHRFSEDVHFMLGIQPTMCMKTSWLLANVILCYAFFGELLYEFRYTIYYSYSPYSIIIVILIILIGIIVHLIVALFKRNFWGAFALDPQWGPKNEVLQRSRGMFSAQAMTKEYMYRQYHLQAGILARQKSSNIRV